MMLKDINMLKKLKKKEKNILKKLKRIEVIIKLLMTKFIKK